MLMVTVEIACVESDAKKEAASTSWKPPRSIRVLGIASYAATATGDVTGFGVGAGVGVGVTTTGAEWIGAGSLD